MNEGAAPPGWYPAAGTAGLRWWDGTRWTEHVTSPTPPSDNRQALAVISHLGFAAGGFIAPLVCYLIAKPHDEYPRANAREALNFNITQMIGLVATFAVGIPVCLLVPPLGVVLMFASILTFTVLAWVFGITGAVRASRGEIYRYPINIRFIRT